jgi:hypothetical protein
MGFASSNLAIECGVMVANKLMRLSATVSCKITLHNHVWRASWKTITWKNKNAAAVSWTTNLQNQLSPN